jgi:hypothetical protein
VSRLNTSKAAYGANLLKCKKIPVKIEKMMPIFGYDTKVTVQKTTIKTEMVEVAEYGLFNSDNKLQVFSQMICLGRLHHSNCFTYLI